MTSQTHPVKTEARRRTPFGILLWILGITLALLLIAALAFVVWALRVGEAMPEAIAALASDDMVTVVVDDFITFTPVGAPPSCGFIVYPGGRVDYRAYAPALRAIAEAGYFAAIVRAPLNLMIFAPNKAAEVIAVHPEIGAWAVGGHSLGGAMAASFIAGEPEFVNGLALWASFPAGTSPLTDRSELTVTSISGSLDGLATPADIEASRVLLPPQTEFVEIQGGNHAQFGWYGAQKRDNPATITREVQRAQTVEATLRMLQTACAR